MNFQDIARYCTLKYTKKTCSLLFVWWIQVVKYWPEIGKCGYLVWRYLLRRDDSEPAPWTPEGQERIKKLGLTVQVKAEKTGSITTKPPPPTFLTSLRRPPTLFAVPAGLPGGHGQ